MKAGVRPEFAISVAILCFVGGFVFGRLSDGIGTNRSSRELQIQQVSDTAVSGFSELIEDLKQQADETPESALVWERLGNAYFDSDQPALAIQAYEKSLAIAPENANVVTDMGVMYRRNDSPEKAIELFDRAIGIDPSHLMARYNKGIVLLHDIQDATGAAQAWNALVKINPTYRSPGGQLVADMVKQIDESD